MAAPGRPGRIAPLRHDRRRRGGGRAAGCPAGRVYHLAGYAQTARSFEELDAAWAGNLGTTRALYEAVRRWGGRPRILFVGSGLVYGDADAPGQLFDEGCLLRPTSPYAASKAAADLLSYQVARAPGST